MTLLKPDEQPQDTINENRDTVKEDVPGISDPNHNESNDNEEDDSEAMDGEVTEYIDENGRRVRRVVKKTVTTTTTRTTSGGDESPKNLTREILEMKRDTPEGNEDEEVMEYEDENGRRVRRIVKKTVTTTISAKSDGDDPHSVATHTREITSGGQGPQRLMIDFGEGGLSRPSEVQTKLQLESKPRALQEKEVFLHFDTKPRAKEERLIHVDLKAHVFPKHDTKTVEKTGNTTTITTESSGGNKGGDNYSSVYKRTVVTKTIGGGDENRSVVEHSTTSSGHDGEHPIVVVKKERSQIDVPEWLGERKSPGTQHRHPETSDISVHLKYPSDYAAKSKEQEEKASESKIHPEVAKRDKPDVSILSLEDVFKEKEKEKGEVKKTEKVEMQSAPPQPASTEDDEEEDEDDEEYDEFEEEIVVMDVKRRLRFPKGLEIREPESEKVGVPIEDLLEVPALQLDQESAPDDALLIEEKIESVERPPVIYAELPDLDILDNL